MRPSPKSRRGSTLIIVVVFLVLLTVLVLGFLARALLDLQISDSSANLSKGDFFARGALDCVVGDLKQEIVDGSISTNSLYLPNTSTNMVPAYSGISPVISNGVETDGLNNVLKVSLNNAPFYKASTINRASNIATTTASLDNHSISLANWNKPLLMPATSTTDLTPTASGFPTPNWIYVARDGSNPGSAGNAASFGTTGTTVNNSSSSNSSYVEGRFAYVIYNEGGLLDANVAGSPDVSSMSIAQNRIWTRKGAAVFADLTQLPTLSTLGTTRAQSIVDTLVGWRSQASAQPSGNFPSYSFPSTSITNFLNFQINQTTSWMTTGNSTLCNNQSDRIFTSRQQLISFVQGIAQNATEQISLQNTLQYLGTFSRCLNQPSYWPPINRPVVQFGSSSGPGNVAGQYPGGNSAWGLDNVYNPMFKAIRVTSTFIRNDGAIAQVGDPLVEKRFALSRLCWLTYKGPSATLPVSDPLIQQYVADGVSQTLLNEGTAANIYNYFGLKWTAGNGTGGLGGFWTYAHGITAGTATVIGSLSDPASTATPKDVLSAKREPDFFELLKAGVCVGAIAKSKTGPNFGTVYSAITESTVTFQILQLGANIINQSNPSQYPIWIKYNYGDSGGYLRSFYGSTDLPYFCSINKVAFLAGTPNVTPGPWPPSDISHPPSTTTTPQTISDPGMVVPMMIPTVWNPYDANGPGGSSIPVPTTLAPSQLRITAVPAGLTDPTNYPGGAPGGAPPAVAPATNSQYRYNPECLSSSGQNLGQAATVTAKWLTEDSTAMTFSNVNSLYRQPTVLFQPGIPTGSNLALGPLNTTPLVGGTSTGFTEVASGTNFIGFPFGACKQAFIGSPASGSPLAPTDTYLFDINYLVIGRPANGTTIRLEFNAGTTSTPYWIPYQEFYIPFDNDPIVAPVIEDCTATNPSLIQPANAGLWSGKRGQTFNGNAGGSLSWGNYSFDPRSARWGTGTITPGPNFLNPAPATPTDPTVASNRPTSTVPTNQNLWGGGASDSGQGWADYTTSHSSANMAASSQNLNNAAQTHYADPDGTIRRAMGGLVSSPVPASTIGLPTMTPPAASSLPVILHRPFRSVTELGYVFSDTPWRNIDFFTPESGYAPLLDVFCINEDYRPDALIAGKVDLNTRQKPVIQALLAGAYRDELAVAGSGGDSPLGSTEAATVANLLLARTSPYNGTVGKGPLMNIADLVGRYVSGSNANMSSIVANSKSVQATYDGFSADLVNQYTGGTAPGNNVIQRFMETAPRALSDSGQVGTWNLLIDIVAQTGRCSANATSLANFFIQGERHYWVHVAIDRQTGKVIDENIELVNL